MTAQDARFMHVQDPNAGPAMVGNACAQVNSVSVPRMSVQWTCGIAVQGDYACGGGMSPRLSEFCRSVQVLQICTVYVGISGTALVMCPEH